MSLYFYSIGYLLYDHWASMIWMVSEKTADTIIRNLAEEENQ